MKMNAPNWDLYRSFLGVMREGSLSRAARVLGLTQPTLGRHIDALEETLHVVLFTRSQHGLMPTAAALELMPHAEAIAAAAEALIRTASGETAEAHGTVRLTASEIMGTEVLPEMLASFRTLYPRIVLELALTNLTQDLLRRDADLAIRHLRPTQQGLVVRRIGAVPIGLYAHRRYAETCRLPENLTELADHPLIGWDRDIDITRLDATTSFGLTRDSFAFRCDSDVGQLAALRAGIAIGACQIAIAARDPDLLPVLPDLVRLELEIWLAMHEDLRASRRVRSLFDHLAKELSGYVSKSRETRLAQRSA